MTGKTTYTDEIAYEICSLLADGMSLKKICNRDDMPSKSTVYKWLTEIDGFSDKYARAREDQADTLADEICDIADDNTRDVIIGEDGREITNHDVIARSRLRVEARKWVAAKLKPKKYGDASLVKHADENGDKLKWQPINLIVNGVVSEDGLKPSS